MEAFIQYKNTDLCMDFHCDCGEHNHYDGYFAYEIACGGCGKKFKLSDKIQLTELTGKDAEVDAMKPIQIDKKGKVVKNENPTKVKTYPNYQTEVVFFYHNDIDKPPYIAGEGKPEIIEPSTRPGNWKKVRDELNGFLAGSHKFTIDPDSHNEHQKKELAKFAETCSRLPVYYAKDGELIKMTDSKDQV